jgi:hypothetical protein
MLAALVVALRSLALICGGHRAVALENLALRQQLAVFKRTVRRPQLRHGDRLFWMLLANAWRDWRTAQLSARTFCTFPREFSSFRRQGAIRESDADPGHGSAAKFDVPRTAGSITQRSQGWDAAAKRLPTRCMPE